jgi:hypothetical protein
MTSCESLYKSKKVQALINKAWKDHSAQLIKDGIVIPKFYRRDFKIGAKQGFMESCQTRRKSIMVLKRKNNNKKTKKSI